MNNNLELIYWTNNGGVELQKSGGKAHGFNRGMKAKKLFAILSNLLEAKKLPK